MNDELYELVEKYLYDELDDGSTAELIEQLEQPEHRRELVEHVQLSAMITRGARQLAGRMAGLRSTAQPAEEPPEPAPAAEPPPSPVWRPALRYALTGVLSAAATLVAVLGLQHLTAPDPPETPAGIAALRRGGAEVHVIRDGTAFAARHRMPIFSGDLLEVTGGGVSLVKYYGENTFVRLHSGTQAAFSKQATGSKHIHLLRGRIAASVSRQPDVLPMEVTALHTKATVLGTRFALAVDEKGTRLGVERGCVRLTHPASGGTVDVDAGYSAFGAASGLAGPALDVDFLPALRGHWAFDDRQGTVAADSSLSFCDAGVVGCAWIDGRLEGALHFDAPGDHARVASPDCGNFGDGSFTLSLWMRPGIGTGRASLLRKGVAGSRGYELTFDQGGRVLTFAAGDGEKSFAARSNLLQIRPNHWYHVLATLNREANCLALQLNGRTIATSPCSGLAASIDSAEPIVMGAEGVYAGALDDVRMYAGILSAAETANLQQKVDGYSAGPSGMTIVIE